MSGGKRAKHGIAATFKGDGDLLLTIERWKNGTFQFELERVHDAIDPSELDDPPSEEDPFFLAQGEWAVSLHVSGVHESLESAMREARVIAPWIDAAKQQTGPRP